ncbi:hypothetical protein BE04_11255 [Sorangium cellulosum]|uniref:DNA circulation N-terminal domain-containing protein n=3 Tax=Sorangium cellulosum TaxID=56 RepID=A0A150PA31_SORCE|nr:hypothetical protein SCE1572_47195 [Sorangium cellulosum So0157-2]KYF52553.1 hypothetical protein BE04_11255 [Sorangium cellulosum]
MLGSWEVPRIESIRTLESRRVATLGVPGLLGDLQQDLGTESVVVEIRGSLHGDQARDDALGALREKFRAGDPVDFVADIVTATELEQVLILGLDITETNDAADSTRYRIVLREYVEPPAPPTPIDDLGADLAPDLDLLAELGLDGLELPDLLGSIPALGNPVEPMRPALARVDQATRGVTDTLLSGLKGALGI